MSVITIIDHRELMVGHFPLGPIIQYQSPVAHDPGLRMLKVGSSAMHLNFDDS